jgi:hypothetical protein
MSNPFYDGENWEKIIGLLKHVCTKANEEQVQCLHLDVTDIIESVLGLKATAYDKSLSEMFESESLPTAELEQRMLAMSNQQKRLREKQELFVECLSDTLTISDFVSEHGTWVLAEYESPEYLLIRTDHLKQIQL